MNKIDKELLEEELNQYLIMKPMSQDYYNLYEWLAICWAWSKLYVEAGLI